MLHPHFKFQGIRPLSASVLMQQVEQFDVASFRFLEEWFNEEDVVIVQTSGSTGIPKQIKLQKKHMVASAQATGTYFNCLEGTKALICLSADFIAGKMMWVRALTLGWDVDVVSPTGNPLEHNSNTYEFSAMVPLQVEKACNQLNQIKKLIVGGAPVSHNLLDKLQEVSTEVFATYGMTETITHIAVKRLNHTTEESFYETLPNVSIQLDERGCLVIDAPTISEARVVTNDLVEIHSESNFEWLGRFDSIINSGGVKLVPEYIERKLQPMLSERFFISSLPDERLGQQLILVIETSDKKDLLQEIKASEKLNKYEIPKQVFTVPEFFETASAKIDKNKILEAIRRTC